MHCFSQLTLPRLLGELRELISTRGPALIEGHPPPPPPSTTLAQANSTQASSLRLTPSPPPTPRPAPWLLPPTDYMETGPATSHRTLRLCCRLVLAWPQQPPDDGFFVPARLSPKAQNSVDFTLSLLSGSQVEFT